MKATRKCPTCKGLRIVCCRTDMGVIFDRCAACGASGYQVEHSKGVWLPS